VLCNHVGNDEFPAVNQADIDILVLAKSEVPTIPVPVYVRPAHKGPSAGYGKRDSRTETADIVANMDDKFPPVALWLGDITSDVLNHSPISFLISE
jgi:hypothetical protein